MSGFIERRVADAKGWRIPTWAIAMVITAVLIWGGREWRLRELEQAAKDAREQVYADAQKRSVADSAIIADLQRRYADQQRATDYLIASVQRLATRTNQAATRVDVEVPTVVLDSFPAIRALQVEARGLATAVVALQDTVNSERAAARMRIAADSAIMVRQRIEVAAAEERADDQRRRADAAERASSRKVSKTRATVQAIVVGGAVYIGCSVTNLCKISIGGR